MDKESENDDPTAAECCKHSDRKKKPTGAEKVKGWMIPSWEQTAATVRITLSFPGYPLDLIKTAAVEVVDTMLSLKFTDGHSLSCVFPGSVDQNKTRTFLKNDNLVVCLHKGLLIEWDDIMIQVIDSGDTHDDISSIHEDIPPSAASGQTEEVLVVDPVKEDPVFYLRHTKYDSFETISHFTVTVYVKQVNKDVANVHFEQKSFLLKFQTSDPKYHAQYPGTGPDTVFCWRINLQHDIDSVLSRFHVTPSLIEIQLKKCGMVKWDSLEPPTPKATPGISKSDSWLPVSSSTLQNKTKPNVLKKTSDDLKNVKLAKTEYDDDYDDEDDAGNVDKSSGERRPVKAETSTNLSSSSNKENTVKPMCKVSPLNKSDVQKTGVVSHGYTGLENLGNTCFMNSVLQALANTREFRDYFLDARYQKDLNTENPLGTGGKLAVSFAVLMKVLWSGTHSSYHPSKLKSLIALKANQFTGYAQHDAQEFMAFLLDGLHEDLNRVKKKPYTENIDSNGRPDKVVADEAWNMYKRRNDSFIVDLFQGQYKSKLVCPECGKVSITFDPFLYLSVPLPKKQQLLPIIFIYKDPHRKPVKMVLRLPVDVTLDQLKDAASRETGIHQHNLRVFESYRSKVNKIFGRLTSLASMQLSEQSKIFVCEVLSEAAAGEPVYELPIIQRTTLTTHEPLHCAHCSKPCSDMEDAKLKRCTQCYKVGYCNQECQRLHWQSHRPECRQTPEPVGLPFIISLPKSRATFSHLYTLMRDFSRYSVHHFHPPVVKPSVSSTVPAGNDATVTMTTEDIKDSLASDLTSYAFESSSLSSSSQSSGSVSSLDSQASITSTCTLTADDHQQADECDQQTEDSPLDMGVMAMDELPSTSTYQIPAEVEVGSFYISEEKVEDNLKKSSINMRDVNSDGDNEDKNDNDCDNDDYADDKDSGFATGSSAVSVSDMSSVCQPSSSSTGDDQPCPTFDSEIKPESTANTDPAMMYSKSGKTLPMNIVHGIQAEEYGSIDPLFHIKPVNQYGDGLTGPFGERLTDKGDEPIDLSEYHFLSMDWRNDSKHPVYVLVQTRPLDADVHPSCENEKLTSNADLSLDQCLSHFTEPEVLSPDEAWYCPQCKLHREATKQLSIWRLPHILIIQLKRFSFRNFIWRDKIDKMVTFPTRGLELNDFRIGSTVADSASAGTSLYDLYGVVNHHGGILGGHYTSFVRCTDPADYFRNEVGWRLCDDSRVSNCAEKNVLTRAAYLLFYCRRQPFEAPAASISFPELTECTSPVGATSSLHSDNNDKASAFLKLEGGEDEKDDDDKEKDVRELDDKQEEKQSCESDTIIINGCDNKLSNCDNVGSSLPDIMAGNNRCTGPDSIKDIDNDDDNATQRYTMSYTDMDAID